MLTANGVIFNLLNINDIAWHLKSSEGGKIKCNTKCNIPGCYTFSDLTNRPPFFRKNARKTLKNPDCNKCNISPIVTLFRLSAASKCLKIRLFKSFGANVTNVTCNIYPRKKIKRELDINILLIINTLRLLFFLVISISGNCYMLHLLHFSR